MTNVFLDKVIIIIVLFLNTGFIGYKRKNAFVRKIKNN